MIGSVLRSHDLWWPGPCDHMRSHAIASDRMRSRKKTFLSRLSKFLKMHREQEAGQKVCLKCFFTTTVNRFHLLFFSPFSKRKKWEAGLILHSKKCFFWSQLSWRNTSGRIFSPVSQKQVPNVFLRGATPSFNTRIFALDLSGNRSGATFLCLQHSLKVLGTCLTIHYNITTNW